jgi:PAS domain S-box-containing protein
MNTVSTPTLAPAMQAASPEIYLLDAATLRLVDANQAARQNLGYDAAMLSAMTVFDLAPELDRDAFRQQLAGIGDEIGAQALLRIRFVRRDGGSYPIKLCVLRIVRDGHALFLAVGDDLSLELAASQALQQYEARFNAVVDHMPGLVLQFVLHADGRTAFPYLSEGCAALLGLSVTELQREPERLLQLILPNDRKGYLDAMAASKAAGSAWNWEGRIRIEAWNDVKWINLRATPQALEGGATQWDGIMTNITDSRREQQGLADLAHHIEQVKEQERTRIAREIHDDLGGNLTAIKMALAMLAARLPDDPALQERAAYVDGLVDRTIEAVHRISLDLRPSTLDLGLVAALEWQAWEFEQRLGIACTFDSPDKDIELDPDHAAALFRIVQEALTNIAKHAGATRVTVTLKRQRQHLVLAICDNGRGITPADRGKPHSFGLRGMSERARALNGTLDVAGAPGGGTMVSVKIRLPSAAARQPESTRA